MAKKIETKNWASVVEYEKIHSHLSDRDIDTSNEYFYVRLLEDKGYDVYRPDLRGWLKSMSVDLDTKSLEL